MERLQARAVLVIVIVVAVIAITAVFVFLSDIVMGVRHLPTVQKAEPARQVRA